MCASFFPLIEDEIERKVYEQFTWEVRYEKDKAKSGIRNCEQLKRHKPSMQDKNSKQTKNERSDSQKIGLWYARYF